MNNTDTVFGYGHWQQGQEYYQGWIVFIVLLLTGFLGNLIVFVIMRTAPALKHSGTTRILRYLTLQDSIWSLLCLLQCIMNLHHGGIFGEQTGCLLQALHGTFFCITTAFTLFLIAFNSDLKVRGGQGLNAAQVWYSHVCVWIFAAIISVSSSLLITPALLVPSGTYCFLNLRNPIAGVVFAFPLTLILSAIVHRYVVLYRYIHDSRLRLLKTFETGPTFIGSTVASRRTSTLTDPHVVAQKRQIQVAKQMCVFVIVFSVCYSPSILMIITESILKEYRWPTAHLIFGLLAHCNSVVNPILYIYMNRSARTELVQAMYGMGAACLCSEIERDEAQRRRQASVDAAGSQIFTRAETSLPVLAVERPPGQRVMIVARRKSLIPEEPDTFEQVEPAQKIAHLLGIDSASQEEYCTPATETITDPIVHPFTIDE